MIHDPRIGDMLAVDPSIRSAGAALFRGGVLVAATTVKLDDPDLSVAPRCLRMAHLLASWACVSCRATPRVLAIEWPQIYRAGKAPGDPNDLPGLAGVGMALAGALAVAIASRDETLDLRAYTPREWAGQLPKSKTRKVASPREERIRSRLNGDERLACPAQHDAVDAVGIGLFTLGRLEPHRALAGAV